MSTPLPFAASSLDPIVQKHAAAFNLDPDFLKSVIYQESRFDPGATSRVGAKGLMQIMPDTAQQPGFGMQGIDPNALGDPETNVAFGARFLREMVDRYGDFGKALVAYNWGPGNADKWVAKGAKFEDLPAETQQYVTNIRKYYAEARQGNPPERTTRDVAASTATSAKQRIRELQAQLEAKPRVTQLREQRASQAAVPTGAERIKDEAEWASKAVLAGVVDTVGLLAMLADGPLELTTPLVNKLEEVSQGLNESMPEWMKESLHKKIFSRNEEGGIEFDWPTLRQVANLTLGSLAPGGAIVGGGRLALRGLGKVNKLQKVLKAHPKLAAATTLGAANSTYISADTYREVYNRVLEQAQSEGMSLKEAHDEASRSASFGATIAGAIAFPTGALGEGLAATGASVWNRLAKGVTLGAITEAPEESGQYLAEQIGSDQPVDLAEFLERGALGAFGAGPVEGVMAALSGDNTKSNLPPAPTPEIDAGLRAGDAAVIEQTEELARAVFAQQFAKKPETKERGPISQQLHDELNAAEQPAGPEEPSGSEPGTRGSTGSTMIDKLRKFPVTRVLPDGSQQHRQKSLEEIEATGKASMNMDVVLSEDAKTPDVNIQYNVDPQTKTAQILYTSPIDKPGTGKGMEVYENVVRDLLDRGYTVHSDSTVSVEASRVYEGLSRRGYTVTRNPAKMNDAGSLVSEKHNAKGPNGVFTVSAPPAGPANQRNMSLPPGPVEGGQLTLDRSDVSDLTPPVPAKPTPQNRKGRFMKQPGPVVPEPEVEPNPAQQELPLNRDLQGELEQEQKAKARKTKKGQQIPMALPPVENPKAVIEETFEKRKTTAHGKRTYGGTRILDPNRHEYNTAKEALDAPKPIGSKTIQIGDKHYIAAPVVTGEVYTEEQTQRPADLTPEEQEVVQQADVLQRQLDAPASRETLSSAYTWAREQYRKANQGQFKDYVRYRLDALGNQIVGQWRQQYEGMPTEQPSSPTPGEAATSAPAATPRAAVVPPSPAASTAPASQVPPALTPTPATEPVETPAPPTLSDDNSTARDGVPDSDKVARNPHQPPEKRDVQDPKLDDDLQQAVNEGVAMLEEQAGEPGNSPVTQQSTAQLNQNQRERRTKKDEFEALLLALARSTNVTWQGLWYRIRGVHSTRAKNYARTHPELMKLPKKELLKRIGKTYLTVVRMYLQDSFLPVRQMQEVMQQAGIQLNDNINFLLAHELMQSKIDDAVDLRKKTLFHPLAQRMRALGVTQEELDNYLWYTHAPHRNAFIKRRREALGDQAHEVGNPNAAGISNEQAAAKRRELVRGREAAFRELDAMIREIAQARRDTYRHYELIPNELLETWDGDPSFALSYDENLEAHKPPGMSQEEWDAAMFYATYVPLSQMAESTEPYLRLLSNLFGEAEKSPAVDVYGDEVRKALGRSTPPDAIVAHMVMGIHMAIIRGERDQTLLKLYDAAKQNPNELLWETEEGGFQLVDPKKDLLTGLPTVVEEASRTLSESSAMRHALGVEGIVAGDRGSSNELEGKGTFRMKRNGKILTVHTYWAPLTKSIRNAERLPRSIVGMKVLGGFSRWIAIANTTLSPGFAVSNLIRDFMAAKINLSEENGLHELNKHVNMKNWKQSMRAYWGELHDKPMPDQTIDPEGYKWRQLARRYKAAGAHTAFFQMRTSLDHYLDIERQARDASKTGTPTKIGDMLRSVYDAMNAGNTTIENAVRLIAFAAAVDPKIGTKQHTDAQAASIAKNLTVNFQKRGHASIWLGALYVFFNATVQGNMRIVGAFRRSPKVRRITYALAAGGFVNAIMNELLGGDDDEGRSHYSQVSQHVRERNLVLMIPGGEGRYVSIPLPYGFNAFWVTGDSLGSALFSDNMAKGPDQHSLLMRPLTAFHNSFNPLGSSSVWRAITPTAGEPFLDIALNKNYFGRAINPDKNQYDLTKVPDAFNVLDPDDHKVAQWVAQTLGAFTGGSPVTPGKVDISPGTLRYLVEYLGGSGLAGATVIRTMDAIPMLFAGEFDKGLRKTPVIRRLYGMTPEFNHRERFYQLREYLANVEEERVYVRSLRQEDPGLYEDFMAEHEVFWSSRIISRMKTAQRTVGRLTERRNKIRAKANKTQAQKDMMARYDERIDMVVTQFNEAYFDAIVVKSR